MSYTSILQLQRMIMVHNVDQTSPLRDQRTKELQRSILNPNLTTYACRVSIEIFSYVLPESCHAFKTMRLVVHVMVLKYMFLQWAYICIYLYGVRIQEPISQTETKWYHRSWLAVAISILTFICLDKCFFQHRKEVFYVVQAHSYNCMCCDFFFFCIFIKVFVNMIKLWHQQNSFP